MKFLAKTLSALAGAVLLVCCSSPKDVLYFQDIDKATLGELSNAYQAVIKKDDNLTIVVTGPDKSVVTPYNLTLSENLGSYGNPERSTLGYLVDSNGDIRFPILGTIHVEGMTRNELCEYLTRQISKDVKDPIVHVDFRNYKVTVLGEVKSPGTYTMQSEKVNVLQAISMAGDLTLMAKREDIMLLREEEGTIVCHKLDLKRSHLLDSPYFFLQQNDVLYIPPSTGRVATGTNTLSFWTSIISSVTSAVAIVTTVLTLTRNVGK